MKLYHSYVFKDKDPTIDELRTLVTDRNGSITSSKLREVYHNGGPTVSCLNAWFFGATRRPQNATLEAAGRALGWERQWKPMDDTAYVKMVAKANKARDEEAAARLKKKKRKKKA